jgi:oligopeptide transport system ATP-binding protein
MEQPRDQHLLEVENLVMWFPVTAGVMQKKVAVIKAVDGISFFIREGETLGLVGESGCGKTTTGRCILQLNKITGGKVYFQGTDLTRLKGEALRRTRRNMQLIFQDPYASLNPRMTAGNIVGEAMLVHNLLERRDYKDQIAECLRMVELEPYMANRYPHEFSGGQRQRIGIARALAVRPSFIVCDEPVSALDVSIQSQIITLLMRLREEHALTYLFIAHDLSVVRHISDRVAVMYLGKIAEITSSDELYDNPLHPYTQALLSAVPIPDPVVDRQRKRILLTGDVPSPLNPPIGCNFHPRCHAAMEECSEHEPELVEMGNEHWVACHRVEHMSGPQ